MEYRNLRVLPNFKSVPEDGLFQLRIRIDIRRTLAVIVGVEWM
jgi:hypothetical protein